jgi:spore germination protein YaaH
MKPGVYAANITIKAMPLKHGTRLYPINRVLEKWPVGLREDGSVVSDYFIAKNIKKENINKYRINYQVDPIVFLSTFNYVV